MLGRLVKWLRILGQDVTYGRHLSGYGLIRAARIEDRIILTRDRSLKTRQPPQFILIASHDYRDQLRQVIDQCGLSVEESPFRRCLKCNAILEARAKELVKETVPPWVFLTQETFFWCPQCGGIYWRGTHHQRILNELRGMGITLT